LEYFIGEKIKSYDFFKYTVTEALFLSDKEEKIILDILQNVESEYQSNIDKFTQELIVAQIERLLIYSERFYERQFFTRKKSSHELLERFEQVLSQYFENGNLVENGIPSVKTIAEQMNISPNYLGTLLRLHTQQNTQQHIQNKLIDSAKERLSTTNLSISEIAYELGFEHPQSFSKLFKQKTNQSPGNLGGCLIKKRGNYPQICFYMFFFITFVREFSPLIKRNEHRKFIKFNIFRIRC
jgi:AraC family transcriptional activator of pobA